jgi:hypothetical protein
MIPNCECFQDDTGDKMIRLWGCEMSRATACLLLQSGFCKDAAEHVGAVGIFIVAMVVEQFLAFPERRAGEMEICQRTLARLERMLPLALEYARQRTAEIERRRATVQ